MWSIILLCHNSAPHIERCLNSIRSTFAAQPYEIVIYDNGSSQASHEILKRMAGDDLQVLYSPVNRGTSVARNVAIAHSRGDALLLLDIDTRIETLPPLQVRAAIEQQPLVLQVPTLLLGDGTIQDSVRRFPLPIDKLRRAWGITRGSRSLTTDRYDLPATEPFEVDSAMAACWALSRQLWERVGPFDRRIFYSPEDLDWCLRCWQAGGRIRYNPRWVVHHYAQKLSHRKVFSRVNLSHLRGLAYYFLKHRYLFRRPEFPTS